MVLQSSSRQGPVDVSVVSTRLTYNADQICGPRPSRTNEVGVYYEYDRPFFTFNHIFTPQSLAEETSHMFLGVRILVKDTNESSAMTYASLERDPVVLPLHNVLIFLWKMSRLVGKPTMWFPNRFDTNRPVQLQKQARSLKFRS